MQRHHPRENALSVGPLQWRVEEECTEKGEGVGLSTSPARSTKVSEVQQEDQDQTGKGTERQ